MTSALPSRRVIYVDIPIDVAHPTLRGSEGLDFVGQKQIEIKPSCSYEQFSNTIQNDNVLFLEGEFPNNSKLLTTIVSTPESQTQDFLYELSLNETNDFHLD